MNKIQNGWRACPKCQGMHFAGFPNFKGVCPAGGQHEETNSFAYTMDFDSEQGNNVQAGWASCPKCQGMHFAGFPNFKGVCPAGGQHEQTNSFAYTMLFNLPPTQNIQLDFRACRKCQGLFFGPFGGTCPAGGQHDSTGSFNYGMRVQPPDPAITLQALSDPNQGRFIEVTGVRFTPGQTVKLAFDIIGFSQDGPTPNQIGEDMLTSDGTGSFIHDISVPGEISGAQARATDIVSGATTTAELDA